MQHPRLKRLIVPLMIATVASLALGGGAVAFVRAGIYNVGADDPHYPATYALLEQMRVGAFIVVSAPASIP